MRTTKVLTAAQEVPIEKESLSPFPMTRESKILKGIAREVRKDVIRMTGTCLRSEEHTSELQSR